jgi:perosamine synthetase
MLVGRTLPPAAAPICWKDILSGLKGLYRGEVELDRFECEIKRYFGVKHCFLVSSGKTALTIILWALKDLYPERDEIVIPAFTCYSVPSAIVRAGLKVRLCDIDPDTLDFDFGRLFEILRQSSFPGYSEPIKRENQEKRRKNEKTNNRLLAIVPTHLFGLPANIDRLRELSGDSEVVIVEDAAQAMGAEWRGRKLGTLGDVAFFSLGRGKALSTGEGGIIVTDRDDIAEKVKLQLGKIPPYGKIEVVRLAFNVISMALLVRPTLFWFPKSIPFLKLGETIYDPDFKMRKMTSFQAGLAKGWQKKVKKFRKDRAKNSKHWALTTGTSFLKGFFSGNDHYPDMIRFPVRIDDEKVKDRLLTSTERVRLGIMPAYPDSIDGIRELTSCFAGESFPVAKKMADHLITLPIHSFVSKNDKDKIQKLVYEIEPQDQKGLRKV